MADRRIAAAFIELRAQGGTLRRDVTGEASKIGTDAGQRIGTGISTGAKRGTTNLGRDLTAGVGQAGNLASRAAADAGTRAGGSFRESFSAGTVDIGRDLATGFAAFGAAQLVQESLAAAASLGEATSKNTVLFGESSRAIQDFGETAAQSIGIGRLEATQAIGTFGNLFRTVKIGQADAQRMSIALVKLAADMGSFNDKSPAEALEAIRSGLIGETEPLRAFGVNLNAAAIEAKAMSLGLAATKGSLTDAAKAQAVYALLMEQTSLAQGDFARTADSASNQQKTLKAEFEDSKIAIGNGLMPVMQALLPILIAGAKAVGTAAEAWSELPGPVQAAIAALLAWIVLQDRITGGIRGAGGGFSAFAASVRETAAAQRTASIAGAELAAVQSRLETAPRLIANGLAIQRGELTRTAGASRELASQTTGLAGVVGRAQGRFDAASSSGQRFGRTLAVAGGALGTMRVGAVGLAGALGGPWGIAIAGATLLLGTLATRSAAARAQQERQTQSIRDYAQALRESNGLIGDNVRQLAAQNLKQSGVLDSADKLGLSLTKIGEAATGNKQSLKELNDALDAIIATEAKSVQNRGATQTAAGKAAAERVRIAKELKAALNDESGAVQSAAKSNDQLARATGQATAAATVASPAQKSLADASKVLADAGASAADKVNALKNALDELAGKANNAREAEAEFAALLDTTKDNAGPIAEAFKGHAVAVDKLTGSLVISTQAGRDQQEALVLGNQKITETVVATYEAALQSGLGQDAAATLAVAAYGRQRAALVSVLTQMTGNKALAEQLASAYIAVPSEIDTAFGQPGMAKSLADAYALGVRVVQIPGTKNVAIYAETAAAQQKLTELGFKVVRLPNGKIGVIVAGDAAAEERLRRLTRDRVSRVFIQTYGRESGPGDGTGRRGGYADGGPVVGPGGPRSDSILARLSNNEHIWTADEVNRAGGHGAVAAMRRAVRAYGRLPGFANGGPALAAGANASPSGWMTTYSVVVNAAPTIPTEQQILTALRNAEALHNPR